MSNFHRGEQVESKSTGEIGVVAHEEDGLVWVVWPMTSENNRSSASGKKPKDIRRVDPAMRQITLE